MAANIVEKVRSIWSVAEVLVEETIVAAEGFTSLTNGQERKRYVKQTVIDFLRQQEAQRDLLPSYAEALAFRAIEFGLDFIIDRVFARLDSEGAVNVAKAA